MIFVAFLKNNNLLNFHSTISVDEAIQSLSIFLPLDREFHSVIFGRNRVVLLGELLPSRHVATIVDQPRDNTDVQCRSTGRWRC